MWGLIAGIIIADQILKIWVKTHMHMGEDIPLIGDWCLLHFVENEGFAFGMTLGGTVGKVILSLVRMVASAALIWFLIKKIRKGIRMSLLLCVTLITAGAMGNLIDCCLFCCKAGYDGSGQSTNLIYTNAPNKSDRKTVCIYSA